MMQDCASSNKIKENKYKILRMSLLLGSDENKVETINNFEDAAREIDAMNDEVYLKDLEGKFYDTLTLEEEEKKLSVLVDYIGGRVEQRISLLTDFANVTGFDLQNLPPIKYYDKLDDYKDRLGYIREYLNNIRDLEKLNAEVEDANDKLNKAYKNKATFEEFNLRNEEIVLNKFQHVINSLDYFKDINEENVEEKLNEVMANVAETKKSLDIFMKSFTTLTHSGISSDEEQEYRSYVTNAQDVYYVNKEEEYFIRLYQFFIHKESEYASLLVKRDCINDLLYERMALRRDLNVSDNDLLSGMYDLLERQYDDIQQQRGNIEEIDHLNDLIHRKKEEINKLEMDNQKVEILALLREFCIIDTYSENNSTDTDTKEVKENSVSDSLDVKDVEENLFSPVEQMDESVVSSSDEKNDEVMSPFEIPMAPTDSVVEEPAKEEYADNQVIDVSDAGAIDLDLVHSKANKVMQRVGEMLGIKPKEEVVSVVSDESKKEEVVEEKEPVAVDAPVNPIVADVPVNPIVADVPDNPMFREPVVEDTTSNADTSLDTTSNDANSLDTDLSSDSNFWFPSETPDALNELPDLEVSNENTNSDNFFTNNPISDLNFPDLKVDFPNNDTEANV